MTRHDPRAFGRKPEPPTPPRNRVPVALLGFGLVNIALAVGMTFVPDVKPATPFFILLSGFVLLLTAVLSFKED